MRRDASESRERITQAARAVFASRGLGGPCITSPITQTVSASPVLNRNDTWLSSTSISTVRDVPPA
jgi:hypothetical protein